MPEIIYLSQEIYSGMAIFVMVHRAFCYAIKSENARRVVGGAAHGR